MAKLVLSLNGSVCNQFFTDQDTLTIGAASDNDIVAAGINAHHARILCVGQDHILEMLNEEHGLLVNGKTCFRQILQHRDVIELGEHHLRYLNTRIGTEVSLDRTMLIDATPFRSHGDGTPRSLPSARGVSIHLPEGHVEIQEGDSHHHSGEILPLTRVITTFGSPGERLVVLTRRPQGFFVTHVEGNQPPRINRKPIGRDPVALRDGDLIEAAGCRLVFHSGQPGKRS